MSRHVVAAADEVPPGGRKLVTVRGRPIAVFNLGGEYFGLLNRCPHQGGSLCEGLITAVVTADRPGQYLMSRQGEIIRCPWHGWEFDIRTGQSWCEPDRIAARQYPVAVESGADLVRGPYLAETIPVAIEADYLVVEM